MTAALQKVTVVVADKNGVLEAKVSYTGAATDAAAFTNTYRSSLSYGDAFSLDVTKTLTGRAQKAGEFGFTIVGADKDATDRLAESDKSFTTIAPAKQDVATKMPGKLADLRFTQADAGKTFTYTLSEVVPDKKLGGVTYDQTTYKIAIQVVDNADGTMKTITTVSKNGGDPVGTYDSSDGRDVVTLGFKNAYKAAPVEVSPDTADLGLYKVLKGRDWLDDRFLPLHHEERRPRPARVGRRREGRCCPRRAGGGQGALQLRQLHLRYPWYLLLRCRRDAWEHPRHQL